MTIRIHDYNPEDPRDAQRVADMFNQWDTAWPGGFTRGVLETAESIRKHMRRRRNIAVCLAEEDDVFIGYCDLQAQVGQQDRAYIPLLGANLTHHGRGVGKLLLREIIRRVTDLGYREVTLGTWAGNTKAVPLYKKTGFQWVPDTNVFMRNFLPSVLTLPQGRAFFANRDWYACLDRSLEIAPDDVDWKGMKVYPYRFRDGDAVLNVMFDAAGERLTALETEDYAVSCSVGVDEAPAGETLPITWEIVPHKGKTLSVVLLAEGEAGLELRVQEAMTIDRETTLTRAMRIRPDVSPRRQGQTPPRIRTTLLIDGEPVILETGVKVVRPVEIEFEDRGLFPGREERIIVGLRNRTTRDLTATLTLDTHPDLQWCGSRSSLSLFPPKAGRRPSLG